MAEDEANILKLERIFLEDEGYEIIPAANGAEALNGIKEAMPDLILLDLDMPGLDGYEVCRRMCSGGARRLPPVIIVSGEIINEEHMRKYEFIRGFVPKPFDYLKLLEKVKELLR